ncbi:MAG: epoxyqueuosine reductase [Thermoplasmata archaeon]|nr:epoxyqueuosine reductase [Thermoplasmata archaeon]
MSREAKKNTEELKQLAKDNGADLFGVADLKEIREISTHPPDLLSGYRYGITIAVSLDRFGSYETATEDQFAFPLLRRISGIIVNHIIKKDHRALAIDPDKILGENIEMRNLSEISHKAISRAAGIGWIGKSALLITPEYGPRVNITSVFTDMPLIPGMPIDCQCKSCMKCILACPVQALIDSSFKDYPRKIDQVLLVNQCKEWKDEQVGLTCWDCVLACPKGRSSGPK